MPDIIGMPYLEAQELLRAEFKKIGDDFVHISKTWVFMGGYEMKVVEQEPKAGEIIYEGDRDWVAVTVGEPR